MSSRRASALHVLQYVALVLLLTMPVWAALTRPGLPATQTGPLPVIQLKGSELEPVPYPVNAGGSWRGSGQLHFKLAQLMQMMGFDATAAVKGRGLLAILLLSGGVFAWASRLAGARAGVLAAVLVAFAPVFLSTLFRSGDWPLLWVMAGLAWAGFGLMLPSRWGLALVAAGAFVAMVAHPGLKVSAFTATRRVLMSSVHPGLGFWALAGLVLLAGSKKRWWGLVALAVGGLLGFFLSATGFFGRTSELPAAGVGLHQLVEPGWLWGVSTLSIDTPLSFSLGYALLALLILAIWSYFQRSEVGDRRSEIGDR